MSMLLDLSRLRGGGERLDRQVPPEAFDAAAEEYRVAAPVIFGADVRKDGEKVRLSGRLTTDLEVACSRCLEPYIVKVDSKFDLLFLPVGAEVSADDDDRQLDDEAANVSFYEDQGIDLAQVMREQFYLALPMKPLCRDDCAGLCPVCGTNQNTGSCSCEREWVDPRLEGLRRLKAGGPES
jgi:uncharacterized protein